MPYNHDRSFTDNVHNRLAVDIIYRQMGWVVQDLNARMLENIDMQNAVDYGAIDNNDPTAPRFITIQERFRDNYYQTYNDFTIRYERPENIHVERRKSEFFKIDADYFVYGIINSNKWNVDRATGFVKYVVIDVPRLKALIEEERIVINAGLSELRCRVQDGKMICPVNNNSDKSSNFVPFDICILAEIAPDVIVYQEGFY